VYNEPSEVTFEQFVGHAIHNFVAGFKAKPGLQTAHVAVEGVVSKATSHGSAIQQFVKVVATATHVAVVSAKVTLLETYPVAHEP